MRPIEELMIADSARSRRFPRPLIACLVCITGAALPILAAPSTSVLPSDVRDVIREHYLSPDRETRYLDAAIDLDGDGQVEFLVHVAGGSACGASGCPTLVFTHLASGFRLLSTIDNSAPPIRASWEISKGWRNLIVRVADGGAPARDVELKFDGRSYPANPLVSSGRVKNPSGGGHVLINAFAFEQMKVFPATP
jgi:hypothetical protein